MCHHFAVRHNYLIFNVLPLIAAKIDQKKSKNVWGIAPNAGGGREHDWGVLPASAKCRNVRLKSGGRRLACRRAGASRPAEKSYVEKLVPSRKPGLKLHGENKPNFAPSAP
jgi:hypothetical protein